MTKIKRFNSRRRTLEFLENAIKFDFERKNLSSLLKAKDLLLEIDLDVAQAYTSLSLIPYGVHLDVDSEKSELLISYPKVSEGGFIYLNSQDFIINGGFKVFNAQTLSIIDAFFLLIPKEVFTRCLFVPHPDLVQSYLDFSDILWQNNLISRCIKEDTKKRLNDYYFYSS